MAKSKPDKRNQKRKKSAAEAQSNHSTELTQSLIHQASSHLQSGQPDAAIPIAQKALRYLSAPTYLPAAKLPVLSILGEAYMEIGDAEEARRTFLEAAQLDADGEIPEEAGGGADKFLWMAQLSEVGGSDSIQWFERGCSTLRREIKSLMDDTGNQESLMLQLKSSKLANALCGVAEIYMTDLSWEDDAEARCEALVTEACLIAPDSPEPLQTLASVRLSQMKPEEARSALQQSLDLWTALPPEHASVPDYATRISLARLLMEAEMEVKAMEVLERLVSEDDSSVEAWYLGGWCSYLLAERTEAVGNCMTDEAGISDDRRASLLNGRRWLRHSLRLYEQQVYEDERLQEHANELVEALNSELGTEDDDEEEEEEEEDEEVEGEGADGDEDGDRDVDDWEDEDEENDDDMVTA